MRAVVMTAAGEPEVLRTTDVPMGQPESRQIRVRLKAAGVNPIDTKLRRRGTFYPERMPAVLGCDGAGVVEELGSGVKRFRPGDEVYFCNGGIGGEPGNYAEYALLDERFAARKPTRLSFAEAAAAPLVLITAWEALHDRGRLAEGQRVLIHAGAGGVGHVAIQLAKIAGAQVCTTVSSPEKAAFVSGLGAEEVIRYREQDFVEAANAWTAGGGVDMALDTVGPEVLLKSFAAVRVYGDVVTLLEPPKEMDWKQARLRNLRLSLELMLTPMLQDLTQARVHHAEILEECGALFDAGRLQIHVARTFPLEEAAAAHAMLETGGMTGKLVLNIGE